MNTKEALAHLIENGMSAEDIQQAITASKEPDTPKPCVGRRKGDTGYTVDGPLAFLNQTVVIDGERHTRHPNGGGLVGENTKAEATVFVGVNARVYGNSTRT